MLLSRFFACTAIILFLFTTRAQGTQRSHKEICVTFVPVVPLWWGVKNIEYYEKNIVLFSNGVETSVRRSQSRYLRSQGLTDDQIKELKTEWDKDWKENKLKAKAWGMELDIDLLWESEFKAGVDEDIKKYKSANESGDDLKAYKQWIQSYIFGESLSESKKFKQFITPNLLQLPKLFEKYSIKAGDYVFIQIMHYLYDQVEKGNIDKLKVNNNYFGFTPDVYESIEGMDFSTIKVDADDNIIYSDIEEFVNALYVYQSMLKSEFKVTLTYEGYATFLKDFSNPGYVSDILNKGRFISVYAILPNWKPESNKEWQNTIEAFKDYLAKESKLDPNQK
jgi:hypothetical protein